MGWETIQKCSYATWFSYLTEALASSPYISDSMSTALS